MKKLRIGMVGAGNIANCHIDAYMKLDNVEIAAICDINEERLNETADKFGIEKRFLSLTEMLNNVSLDAADVCVWNCSHADCTIEALDAGLHVLCEKPMAYSEKEALLMIEAAKKNNKLLMIGFTMRFGGTTRVVKDFIDNGTLGEIYHVKASYLRRHGSPGGWFGNKALSGGGPVIDLGVHVIDLNRYLMGNPKPVSVYAVTQNKLGDRRNLKTDVEWKTKDSKPDEVFDVEDFATVLIRYENGATMLLETSYSLNGEEGTKQEIFGTKGGIKFVGGEFTIYTEMHDYMVDVTPKIANLKGCAGTWYDEEMAHFADCALNGTECIAPAEDGAMMMKILDAIYESARTGHEVIL